MGWFERCAWMLVTFGAYRVGINAGWIGGFRRCKELTLIELEKARLVR